MHPPSWTTTDDVDDGSRVWVALLPLQESRISSADFYRDGSLFITGADDETMHLYDTVSGT